MTTSNNTIMKETPPLHGSVSFLRVVSLPDKSLLLF